MSNESFGMPLSPAAVVYSALYRLDAQDNPLPDLTAGPCEPMTTGTVIECRLIDTVFQDGTPLTADDVAYTYQLRQQDTCEAVPFTAPCLHLPDSHVRSVVAVDSKTVDFTLTQPDPTFLTTILPAIAIDSRHVVESAYADLVARAKDLRASDLNALAGAIDRDAGSDPPVCAPHVAQAEAFLGHIGYTWFRDEFIAGAGSAFDQCGFVSFASIQLQRVAGMLGSTGLAAVEAAYPELSFNRHPIGTGPYRFVSVAANKVSVEASSTYHGGQAATKRIEYTMGDFDGQAIVNNQVDISPSLPALSPSFLDPPLPSGIRIALPPTPAWTALHFNARPGHLFGDRSLRLALALCIDKPRDVDAATRGLLAPAYSPYMPGSWGYDDALPKPTRDVPAANQLIRDAGWHLGADGVYVKDGRRLSAVIVVRGDRGPRVHFADLVAQQTRDCGMDLKSDPVRFGGDIVDMLEQYPHDIPDTKPKQPFDLYLGTWVDPPDPGGSWQHWATSTITDPKQPDGGTGNLVGFSDSTVDRLIADSLATYDQARRASDYRAIQEELAKQQPVLFAWGEIQYGAIRTGVTSLGAPLDLSAPNWYWQPERLAVSVGD